jgi:hypothetical protein
MHPKSEMELPCAATCSYNRDCYEQVTKDNRDCLKKLADASAPLSISSDGAPDGTVKVNLNGTGTFRNGMKLLRQS